MHIYRFEFGIASAKTPRNDELGVQYCYVVKNRLLAMTYFCCF